MSEAATTAQTIRKQLGIFGLGVVGASHLAYTSEGRGGLTFKARLHFKGQSRVRLMRVTVTLNAMDTYDIHVYHGQREATFEGIYADGLVDFMYRLDAEGI